jgi:hypothetical protein
MRARYEAPIEPPAPESPSTVGGGLRRRSAARTRGTSTSTRSTQSGVRDGSARPQRSPTTRTAASVSALFRRSRRRDIRAAGNGKRHRVTVMGPGVTPVIQWEGAGLGGTTPRATPASTLSSTHFWPTTPPAGTSGKAATIAAERLGPVAQPVFKTGEVWQPQAGSVRLRRRSVEPTRFVGRVSAPRPHPLRPPGQPPETA